MNATEAVEFMRTGKKVRSTHYHLNGDIIAAVVHSLTSHYYYQYCRNDVILQLLPLTTCAADVMGWFTSDDFISRSHHYKFEEYLPA